jgi:uncharacterized protein
MTTFRPHPLLQNPHLQTLAVNLFAKTNDIAFSRVRLETPDDDFLDIDIPQVFDYPVSDDAPIVLVIHGLESNARRGYVCAAYRELAKVGIRSVGMNLRGCSGEYNRKASSYHLGATADVALVHEWLDSTYPNVPKAIMGFSLGANLTLKYCGENGDSLKGRLVGAIAISPPFDLRGRGRMEDFPGTIYARYLLSSLKKRVYAKAQEMDVQGANSEMALGATTLRVFDRAITAPLHGFKDEDEYYAKCGCGQFLAGIRIPALIIRAVDDPFFRNDIPYEAVAKNPHIKGLFPVHGGHCGFIEGILPATHIDWAQKTGAEWVNNLFLGRGASG